MEEPIIFNDKPLTYRYNNNQIEVYPCFLYEVNLYKISKNSASILSTRYYTSNKLLKINEVTVTKRFKNFSIERFITLLGAPASFIEENNLPLYEGRKNRSKISPKILKKV